MPLMSPCRWLSLRLSRTLPVFFLGATVVGCSSSSSQDPPGASSSALASCTYTSHFTEVTECREYATEGGWSETTATEDCQLQKGTLVKAGCSREGALGSCLLPLDARTVQLVARDGSDTDCRKVRQGCTNISGGDFTPLGACVAALGEDGPPNFATAQPMTRVCRDPRPGEQPGHGDGGQVCPQQSITGATEEGRLFADYADCNVVRAQRPYAPLGPSKESSKPDERLNDAAYKAELDWVTAQTRATGCTCCHQASVTPQGPAVWDVEAGGNWVNTFSAYGLAFAGGVIDSHLLGAYPASDNNGFARDLGTSRDLPGIPSTDPARMKKFFLGELTHRGLSVDDFAGEKPTPGFAYQLDTFQPVACGAGSGVDKDGTIRWAGPPARYVRVLDRSSKNPVTAPNLDNPTGTLWRLDVAVDQPPLDPGTVRYGVSSPGTHQHVPESGSAPALTGGQTYYLYVELDTLVPVERCLFTF